MSLKSIYGKFATSDYLGMGKVLFNEETGLIEEFIKGESSDPCDYSYNEDCLIFYAMGDVHIHAREDVSGKHLYKEDFISATEAAINGGVGHVCDMPNNPVPPIDDESYRDKLKLTDKALVPLFIYAGIGPETKPLSIKVPYKAYMGPSVGDLFFKDHDQLREALKHYGGQWVSFHCEDPKILEDCKNESTHLKRRPVQAGISSNDSEALECIKKFNLKGKLCHYSSGEGLKLILKAKEEGLDVTCEATPQHLYFNDDDVGDKPYFQMNPPIREKEDSNALLDAFLKGQIDFLATDHAPHSEEEKLKGTSGLPGLDTFGGFVTWLLVEKKMDPKLVALSCSENPGRFVSEFLPGLSTWDKRFLKMGKGFGKIEKDFVADFTVLNLNCPTKIEIEDLKTKAKNSPFVGITFPGKVEQLFGFGTPLKK